MPNLVYGAACDLENLELPQMAHHEVAGRIRIDKWRLPAPRYVFLMKTDLDTSSTLHAHNFLFLEVYWTA